MAYQSEAALEQQFIEQLNKQEYSAVSIPDYDALVANFKVQFEAFNAAKLDTPLTDKEWERIFNLMLGKSVFQSAKILRDKFVLEREDGTKVYLSFFDNDHTKNIFQATNQTTVVGKYVNRYDVTILVNGLPLIQVELKRRGIDIREAVNQVMRYKKHSYNGLYHFIQLFVVSNGVDTKYFANSDRDMLYSLAFFWTDFNNVRITNLKDFSISFLARDHIIKMLTRYTILNDTDKLLMVMRPYQVYAVEALVRQATLTNRNAYVWHTTGAGKTLTSFKTAQILAANPNIKKVIFLVDRKDLDSQTTEEFNKFEIGSVDATDRTDVLVKQMQDKNRQLIVTTMQKMANAVKRPQYAKIMSAYKDEKVVFIIDECHRSQFGDMHKDIVRHFQKAQFFGFTGTPRFEVNGKTEGKIKQTTEMLFGECVHNYLIKDANLVAKDFLDQETFCPTNEEQAKISSFLNLLEKRIDDQLKLVELLKKYKRGVMQHIFHQRDAQSGEVWTCVRLGDIFKKVSRRNTNGMVKNVITNSAEYGLIPQRDFFDKDIAVDGNTANYYVIEEGDFVYNPRKSNTAPYGPFNRYTLNERGIISPLYTCLVLHEDINPSYLAWYFRSDAWHRYIYDNGSQGVRHDRVSMTDDLLMGIPVMFPDNTKQQVYADILDKIETRLQAAQKEYELLIKTKDGYVQQLFI